MDARLILETGVISACAIVVGSHLYDTLETNFELHSLGFSSCVVLMTMLHQLIPEIKPGLKRPEGHRHLYRNVADPGVWCCVLYPSAWLSLGISAKSMPVLEMCFLLYSAAIVLVHYNPSNSTQIAAALLLLWLRSHLIANELQNLALCAGICVMFYFMLSKVRDVFPKSFTEGEVSMLPQLLCYILLSLSLTIAKEGYTIIEDLLVSQKIAVIAFEGVLMATLIFLMLSRTMHSSTKCFYISYSTSFILVVIPLMLAFFGPKALSLLVNFILKNQIRVNLLCWWLWLVCVSIFIVYMGRQRNGAVSTVVRKLFHVIVAAVYIPGLLYDPEFLYTASIISIGVLVILETMRLQTVWPLGKPLNEGYEVFVDDQDQGHVILTPLYLLVGISLPLWIFGAESLDGTDIRLYAGVLSLGVGDTMASVGGTLFGYYKLPGGTKTLEGTSTSILFQCLALYGLRWLGVSVYIYTGIQAVVLTSLLEAFTKQIDNLVLPPVMFSLLSVLPSMY